MTAPTFPGLDPRKFFLAKLFNKTDKSKAVVDLIEETENPLDKPAIKLAALVDIFSGEYQNNMKMPVVSDYLMSFMIEAGYVTLDHKKRPCMTDAGFEELHACLLEMDKSMVAEGEWPTEHLFHAPKHKLGRDDKAVFGDGFICKPSDEPGF